MTHLQPVGKGIEFFCVNRQETTLLQEGAANIRIPAFDRTFLLSEDWFAGILLLLLLPLYVALTVITQERIVAKEQLGMN